MSDKMYRLTNFGGFPVYRSTATAAERRKQGISVFMAGAVQGPGGRYIVVYPEFANLPRKNQYFVLWHEVAHLRGYQKETDADQFACNRMGTKVYEETIRYSNKIRKSMGLAMMRR